MIYNLNGDTHWELSPELMRALVAIVDGELLEDRDQPADLKWPDRMVVELCNFRSAIENELARLPVNADLVS